MIEKRFGRLIVMKFSHKDQWGGKYWCCECDCGNLKTIYQSDLICGKTKSCGCYSKEITSKINKKHGLKKHPLYSIWCDMKKRCYNKNQKSYKNYGMRGIKVCNKWLYNFEEFFWWAISAGWGCPGLQIDRINNNKNYSPENCRWVTRSINSKNRNPYGLIKEKYIWFNKKTQKYIVQVCLSGKQKYIGGFKTLKEAINKREEYLCKQ